MSGAARPGGTILSGVRRDGVILPVQAGQADTRVDPAALDGQRYLASLLAEGLRTGLLTESDAGRVRDESLLLLREQAERWTDGRCGSIRAENAQALLETVFYAAGVSLRTRGTPEAAIAALRETPLRKLYETGQAARLWQDTPPERRAALLSGALDQIAAETGCSGEVVRYLAPALPEAGRLLADAEARLI